MLQPQVSISATAVNEKLSSYPAIVTLPLLNDNVGLESDEEYTLSLSAIGFNIIVDPATTRIVIQDDDGISHMFI